MRSNALCALILVAAGCSVLGPTHDLSRFYTLSPRDTRGTDGAEGGGAFTTVVGPITFPAYLDRNEVAVRVSPTELKYPSAERWAEPLVANFARVLVEDLGTALGSDRVLPASASIGAAPDYRVEVVVLRFESATDGSAQLSARWAVRDATNTLVRLRQSQHARQATTATTEGGVSALSAALGDLADEMASVLREIRADRSAPAVSRRGPT